MSIVGIRASKEHLYVALTSGGRSEFSILEHHRLPVSKRNFPALLENLSSIVGAYHTTSPICKVAILKCNTGRFSASGEALKAEGIAELLVQQSGYNIEYVTTRRLSGMLCCDEFDNWEAAARAKFDPEKKITYFSSGFNGAISAAFAIR